MSGIVVENGKTENVMGDRNTNKHLFVQFDTAIFIYSVCVLVLLAVGQVCYYLKQPKTNLEERIIRDSKIWLSQHSFLVNSIEWWRAWVKRN